MDVFIRFLNPLLMICLGLGAGVLLAGRRPDGWRLYFAGALTFILSQVFHIPFNSWVLAGPLARWLPEGLAPGAGLLPAALALGLSAGLFEESARWLAYRFALRDARSWRDGLAFGSGHGGIEAVLTGVLALSSVLQLVALRAPDAAAVLQPDQVEALAQVQGQVAAFWALPWYGVLLGALERLFAICFHLSASLLVLQVFRRGSGLWLAAAVAWHTLLNAATLVVMATWGPYAAEAALGLLALASLWMVRALRSEDVPPPVQLPAPLPLTAPQASDSLRDSAEQIEDSRFGNPD